MKIVITGDLHLGMSFDYKKSTGVSERAIDFLNQFKKIVDHAIGVNAELLLIAGDFYDKTVVSANVKKILLESILAPAIDKIRIIIIGGNHDSPAQLDRGCDIEHLAIAKKITCIRSLKNNVLQYKSKSGESIGMVFLPYAEPPAMLDYYMKGKIKGMEDVKEITHQIAVEFISGHVIVPGLKKICDASRKILIGHYYVEGSKDLPFMVNSNSTVFSDADLHASEFDAVFMGHLHQAQTIKENIYLPGSIEKVKFDEKDHEKSFIVYDTGTNKCEKVPLTCRKMVQIDIDTTGERGDPMKVVLEGISKVDVKDALVKVVISVTQSMRNIIRKDESRIEESLKDSFHPLIQYKIYDENRPMIDMSRVELNPVTMLEEYLKSKFKEDPDLEQIKARSMEILGSCKLIIEGETDE